MQRAPQPRAAKAPSLPRAAKAPSLFLSLPEELQLRIADEVTEWQARAALCLAIPPLGIEAIRTIAVYKDPLFSIAMALWYRSAGEVLDERRLRSYAAERCASVDGCKWLNAVAIAKGLQLGFNFVLRANGISKWMLTFFTAPYVFRATHAFIASSITALVGASPLPVLG